MTLNDIPCIFLNARSIVNKISDLSFLVEKTSPKIIFINETWITAEKNIETELSINNRYDVILANRKTRGGGCAILISRDIPFKTILSCSKYQCELININLFLPKKINIFLIYRPPNCSLENTKKILKFLYENIENNFILCGDMNIPNINWVDYSFNCQKGKLLLDFMFQTNSTQHVTEFTRLSSTLDLIFSSPSNLLSNVKITENFSNSDHNMITFNINSSIPFNRHKKKVYKRQLTENNFSILNEKYANYKWTDELSFYFSVNSKYNAFTDTMLYFFDSAMPLKPLNNIIKENYPKRITELSRNKLKLFKESKKDPNNNEIQLKYKIISRQLRKITRDYYTEKDKRIVSKGRSSVYKYFKNKLKPVIQVPTLFDKNGEICLSDKAKSNAMGITFQKAFNKKNSELVIGSNFTKSADKIEDIQFNILDIFKLLRKLPNKNSTSPDSIPYILLKKCAFTLSHIITELFRLILDEGEIPEIWKHSIVIPIFKKGDKTITDNYRPIALTCTLCRTFERLLVNKLIEFLRNKDFFSIEQFGFLKQRSTVTQLLTMLNQIYSCVDRGNKVDIVYIDFKKAFDTVPIELLIQKVKHIGIDGKILKFLINFLNNRKFKVRIEQDFSEEYPIHSGVPQGSVLGPLLFVIFINDLPEHLPKGVNIKIYADDIKLYVEHNNDNNRNKLKESLVITEKWAKNNGLGISIDKCICLYIGKNNDKQQYFIDGQPIKKENCVRDLGILIDTDLSFSAHITKITKQAYSMIYQIFRIFKSKDLDNLVFVFKTYLRPLLEYATEIWSPSRKDHLISLEKIQKIFTKRAFKQCGLVDKPYEIRLQICKLKKLEERRVLADLCMTYKILNNFTHLEQEKYFTLTKRAKRRIHLLQNKRFTSKSKNNFFARIVSLWNKLPREIVEIRDLKKFREYTKRIDLLSLSGT